MNQKTSQKAVICGVVLFLSAMIASLVLGSSIIWVFLLGYTYFTVLALRNGQPAEALFRQTMNKVRNIKGLLFVLLLLGALTAAWRASGTVILFVYYGVQIISPGIFLVLTFVLTSILGYVIGTSFGVSSIMGAIFMTIGAAGDVTPLLTAGAIMSGVYFGDRASPASSSFLTIAEITKQQIGDLLKVLLRDGMLPFGLSLVIYSVLSILNPLRIVDDSILQIISNNYRMTPVLLIPAVFVVIFPFLKMKTWQAMMLSIGSAGIVGMAVQGLTLKEFLQTCLQGYVSPDAVLGPMINGGGILGMVEICIIVCLTCTLAPLLQTCGLVEMVRPGLKKAIDKVGVTVVGTCLLFGMNAIFCNQSAGQYLFHAFLSDYYPDRSKMALDLSNTTLTAALIPWSLACSVPLGFIGVGIECLPFACFLYLTPICNCLRSVRKQRRAQ